jgi:hypothetical protein
VSRWRRESRRNRSKALLRVAALGTGLSFLVEYAYDLHSLLGMPAELTLLATLGLLGGGLARSWATALRRTTIPLSTVEAVELHADGRELTLVRRAEAETTDATDATDATDTTDATDATTATDEADRRRGRSSASDAAARPAGRRRR